MLKTYNRFQLHTKTINSHLLIFLTAAVLASCISSLVYFNNRYNPNYSYAAVCSDVYNPLPDWITTRVNENKAIYVQVATETGVPWEMIAAVHYREFNLRRDINPANGQGIYQMYSIYQSDSHYRTLADADATVTDDNFREQTRYAARFIQEKALTAPTPMVPARNLTVNESSVNLIKNTLFSYNGRASSYAIQAEQYGFSRIDQPFEGSPYVMNKFDCNRSSMRLITTDGSNELTAIDTRLGAFTLYARLKGDAYWTSLAKRPLPQCNEAKVGCVWEFENEDTGRRFYTSSATERDYVYSINYQPVGIAFHTRKATDPNSAPIYRMYNTKEGWHLWTASTNERSILVNSGDWRDEGTVFHMDPSYANTGDPVRRLYSLQDGGKHILTSNSVTINKLLTQGFRDEGIVFVTVNRKIQDAIPPPEKVNVYRFYFGSHHFWTTSMRERDTLANSGYKYENTAWTTPVKGEIPVYRVYSPSGYHFWTTSLHEKNILVGSGWRDEGVGWKSAKAGEATYRLYNTHTGKHLFTTSTPERTVLLKTGYWRNEGIAWYQ